MPFLTRPHFEDRQIVQYGDESIKLSGTSYIASTVLGFSGITTGETSVTINTLTGYLRGERLSGLVIEPARLALSGTTGTTTQNVTGFVLQSIDPYGSVEWAPISGVSWSVSACTSPLYVSTIEACPNPTDPIYITAGNVQFGASPSLIADITNTRLGIGTGSPSESLHIENGDILIQNSSGERFYSDMGGVVGPRVLISADTNSLASFNVTGNAIGGNGGLSMGIIGLTASFPGYGKQGDGFVYSSVYNNGLNIISSPTTGPQITDDYIRFYAGQDASGTIPDLHIQGSGVTRGNIGINTINPTEKLHVEGSIKMVDGNEQNGYVLTSDTNGVGSWVASADVTFTGNTSGDCITDLYLTNLYGCSPLHIEPSGLNDVYMVENGGNVGIGTTSPTSPLHISSDNTVSRGLYIQTNYSGNSVNEGIRVLNWSDSVETPLSTYGGLFWGRANAQNRFSYGVIGAAGLVSWTVDNVMIGVRGVAGTSLSNNIDSYGVYGESIISNGGDNIGGYFVSENVGSGNTYAIIVPPSGGTVGIGTETPTEKLHVEGNIKMVDGNQSSGYVMTSDANGVGSWQSFSGSTFWGPAGSGGISADTSISTVYVPTLNISSVPTGDTISILAITSGGTVVDGTNMYSEICKSCSGTFTSSGTTIGTGSTVSDLTDNLEPIDVDCTSPKCCTQWEITYYGNRIKQTIITTNYDEVLKYKEAYNAYVRCIDSNNTGVNTGGIYWTTDPEVLPTPTYDTKPSILTGVVYDDISPTSSTVNEVRKSYKVQLQDTSYTEINQSNFIAVNESALVKVENSINGVIAGSSMVEMLSSTGGFIKDSNRALMVASHDSTIKDATTSSIISSESSVISGGTTGTTIVSANGVAGTDSYTLYTDNMVATNDITATTFYGDGSNLTGISGGVTIDPYQGEGNVNVINWDVSGTSTNYEATLTGDTTLNITNVRNGDYGTLIVTQDGTGSHILTFGGGTNKVVNGGGGAPTLTSTSGATDILSFTYNGTNFYWTVGNDYT